MEGDAGIILSITIFKPHNSCMRFNFIITAMNIIKTLLDAHIFQSKKTVKRHQFLKLSGEKDTNIYFIEKGSVRIL